MVQGIAHTSLLGTMSSLGLVQTAGSSPVVGNPAAVAQLVGGFSIGLLTHPHMQAAVVPQGVLDAVRGFTNGAAVDPLASARSLKALEDARTQFPPTAWNDAVIALQRGHVRAKAENVFQRALSETTGGRVNVPDPSFVRYQLERSPVDLLGALRERTLASDAPPATLRYVAHYLIHGEDTPSGSALLERAVRQTRESQKLSLAFLNAVISDATVSCLGVEGARRLLEEIIRSIESATSSAKSSDGKISAFRSVSAAIADSGLGAARVPLFQQYIETTGHEIHAVHAGIGAIGRSDLNVSEQASLLRLMLSSSPSVKDQPGYLPWMMSIVVEEARLGEDFIPLFEDALAALAARSVNNRAGAEWEECSSLEKLVTSLAEAELGERGLSLFQRFMERAYRLETANFRMQLVRHIVKKKQAAMPESQPGPFDDVSDHRSKMNHIARAVPYYEKWWSEILAGLAGDDAEAARLTRIFLAHCLFAGSLLEADIGEAGFPFWERFVEKAEAEKELSTLRGPWFNNAFFLSEAVKGARAAQLLRRLERVAGDRLSPFEVSQFARAYHRMGAQDEAERLGRVYFEMGRRERRHVDWKFDRTFFAEIGGPSFGRELRAEWDRQHPPARRSRRAKA